MDNYTAIGIAEGFIETDDEENVANINSFGPKIVEETKK